MDENNELNAAGTDPTRIGPGPGKIPQSTFLITVNFGSFSRARGAWQPSIIAWFFFCSFSWLLSLLRAYVRASFFFTD